MRGHLNCSPRLQARAVHSLIERMNSDASHCALVLLVSLRLAFFFQGRLSLLLFLASAFVLFPLFTHYCLFFLNKPFVRSNTGWRTEIRLVRNCILVSVRINGSRGVARSKLRCIDNSDFEGQQSSRPISRDFDADASRHAAV